MQNEALIHSIIGYTMELYSVLWSGFSEVIYQQALAIELEREELLLINFGAKSLTQKTTNNTKNNDNRNHGR
ncbi:GxxExxY protein [Pedobacter anseongensis]|uniref:GxxExxY protein n=1 Tax=Pedobacter anseongensis TaxID=3133439 RepID=UPI003D73DA06